MSRDHEAGMPKRALIVLAEGFEEIEAVSPIDILRRARIDVIVAGLSGREVKGAHGIKISADVLLKDAAQDIDALILPGGSPGAENLAKSKELAGLIIKMFKAQKIIAAICAAPSLVLDPTGILENKKATCFPGMENLFSARVKFLKDRVVRDGNLITSRGPGTAMAFSLAIVEALAGKKTADTLKQKILAFS